jgi:hydroxyacylglutathione hydrolase
MPDTTRVYCGHEYTLSNLRFALAVEPDSPALRERETREKAKRDRGVPTLPTSLADERATNPFLRVAAAPVRAAVEARAGRRLDGAVETFAALRAWKNAF